MGCQPSKETKAPARNGGAVHETQNQAFSAEGAKARKPSVTNMALPPIPGGAAASEDGPDMYIALYDYDARTEDDLTFRKGDKVRVLNNADGDWWQAQLTTSPKKGYIPSNYVAKAQSIEAEDWFHGRIKRQEAEKILLQRGAHGGFLLRESESTPGEYSLSVRDGDNVKHYRIRTLDGGCEFPRGTRCAQRKKERKEKKDEGCVFGFFLAFLY
jgi:hypothetical protein